MQNQIDFMTHHRQMKEQKQKDLETQERFRLIFRAAYAEHPLIQALLDEDDFSFKIFNKPEWAGKMTQDYLPLFYAYFKFLGDGKETYLKKMLPQTPDLDLPNENGNTTLHILTAFYLNSIPEKTQQSEIQYKSALFQKRTLHAMHLLIQKGANMHVPNKKGFTPVHLALYTHCTPLLFFFKDRGAFTQTGQTIVKKEKLNQTVIHLVYPSPESMLLKRMQTHDRP